ncbi:MAG: hypothetical protein GY829_13325 [Gammaproteobacteria bacterium]|nr:hypothetical protein [Gammaproteobacteria bacterium]
MNLKTSVSIILFGLFWICTAQSNTDYLSYHAETIEIHNSPIKYHQDQSDPYNLGVRYRAVIGIAEIYYFLIVEKHIVGDEGSFDFHSYKSVKAGSKSEIKFIKWQSPTTFLIEQEGKEKLVVIKNDGSATIK